MWATFMEWVVHRYFLHGMGKRPGSALHFHWEHHRLCRSHRGGADPDYLERWWTSWARIREMLWLLLLALIHAPLLLIAPGFAVPLMVWSFVYYFIHRASHRWPRWGWRWVPWHMEHHLVQQNKNWGVTNPIWDRILGTYITDHERSRAGYPGAHTIINKRTHATRKRAK